MTSYFLESIDPKLVRVTTLLNHKDLAQKYIVPLLGKIRLNLLKPEHVQRMIDTMVRQGVGVCTIRRTREALSAILREAVKLEYVQRNVARLTVLPKNERKEKSVWNSTQVAHFLENTKDHHSYPLFLTMFHYGLRRSEVFGLRWIDVDFNGDEIHIRRQRQHFNGEYHILPPKSKAGIRNLPLMPILKEKLFHLKKEYDDEKYTDGLVFRNKLGNPVTSKTVSDTFHYLSRAERPLSGRKV
jgi:integrase